MSTAPKRKKPSNNNDRIQKKDILPQFSKEDVLAAVAKVKKLSWVKYQYKVEIWIDSAEPPLFKSFIHTLGIEVKEYPLCVGDYMFILVHKITGEYYVFAVIERKALSDFWASIKDQRFRNQKVDLFLFSAFCKLPISRTIYLVENEEVSPKYFSHNALLGVKGAKLNLYFRDRMTIIETMNKTDTLYTLATFVVKMHEFLPDYEQELQQQRSLQAANMLTLENRPLLSQEEWSTWKVQNENKTLEETQGIRVDLEKLKQALFPEPLPLCTCDQTPPLLPSTLRKTFLPKSRKKQRVGADLFLNQLALYDDVGKVKAQKLADYFKEKRMLVRLIQEETSAEAIKVLTGVVKSGKLATSLYSQLNKEYGINNEDNKRSV